MAELTPEQKQKIVDWLKHRNAPRACSVCGANDWNLAAHLVVPSTWMPDGGISLGGVSYPQAMLLCKNCSHTIYFNAVIMGVLEKKEGSGGTS